MFAMLYLAVERLFRDTLHCTLRYMQLGYNAQYVQTSSYLPSPQAALSLGRHAPVRKLYASASLQHQLTDTRWTSGASLSLELLRGTSVYIAQDLH